MKTPCSDYVPTNGVIFFARMLDKLRLKNMGLLPHGYNYVGCDVWDCFDARFCRFFGVEPDQLLERILAGGTDEEILEWCFETFGRPSEEKIEFWNSFIVKRGWRDESSRELKEVSRANGFANRSDVQTWVDFHDVDEGRTPRANQSFKTEVGSVRKVNLKDLEEYTWASPKGKFGGAGREVSEALGGKSSSTHLSERHPFDVEVLRLTPGQTPYPYHSHSAQWEFYHVISGKGLVRHKDGSSVIEAGDAFLFPPGEAHQLTNDGSEDLVILVIADNPIGESGYYPDSKKWLVRSPERRIMRGETLDYFDGEE